MKRIKKFSLYGYKTKEELENVLAILKTYKYVIWRDCSTNIYGIDRKPGEWESYCDIVLLDKITINNIESVYNQIKGDKPSIESVKEKLMNFICVKENYRNINSNRNLADMFKAA